MRLSLGKKTFTVHDIPILTSPPSVHHLCRVGVVRTQLARTKFLGKSLHRVVNKEGKVPTRRLRSQTRFGEVLLSPPRSITDSGTMGLRSDEFVRVHSHEGPGVVSVQDRSFRGPCRVLSGGTPTSQGRGVEAQ